MTPLNAAVGRHSSLAATYTLSLSGKLVGLSLALSTSGIDVEKGLLNIPAESGYRAFDVFYYLLTAGSTPTEREFLGLKQPSAYCLLNRSGTYEPPAYLPAADDAAAAEDFRASLKAIGIKGTDYRGLLSALAGLLKLGEATGFLVESEALEDVCEDVGGLIGLEPEIISQGCGPNDRRVVIAAIYEALIDWVVAKANDAIADEIRSDVNGDAQQGTDLTHEDQVSLTVVEIPGERLGKAIAMRGIFDDTLGINLEMKDDGVDIVPAGHSVLKEMASAVAEAEADLGITGGPQSREREHNHERREEILGANWNCGRGRRIPAHTSLSSRG